ncbi:hypothetical protein JAAARDRAFT_34489 [Jaapia argillacea MUCL 33604]|uniref:Uncharacterized protein n=1 Tax=Jaapia argillacea MUCL 33604 TaxID=933084 RepID=A0A067Q7S5_9AGAM|nr:hypothetical protein JAAARDRAFT_34489 [Jaapia argillacea MUCL 33604]
MVDWQSPAEIARDAAVFAKFMHVLLGLYIWEFCMSLPFDYDYIRGKRKFHWPLVFYFANRYVLLFALVGIAVSLNVSGPINCQALYTFNQVFGNATVGLASINLSIRTMIIWGLKWYIVGPLVAVIIGHWTILLHGVLLKAAFFPGQGCVITQTSSTLLATAFIYAMAFDLIVLLLTGIRLAFPLGRRSVSGGSKLFNLIFTDGLIFFIVAFLSNLIATIFMLVDLNPVMSVIANVPAAIGSTIVATRAVRRLNNFSAQQNAEIIASTRGSTRRFRIGRTAQQITTMVFKQRRSDSIHLPLESLSATERDDDSDFLDFPRESFVKSSPYDLKK